MTNKERFILNFRKSPVTSVEKIHEFLDQLNDKRYGKKITLHEVIADCVENSTPREIERIQQSVYSAMDRIRIKFEQDMEKSEKKLSFEQYLAKKLKVN